MIAKESYWTGRKHSSITKQKIKDSKIKYNKEHPEIYNIISIATKKGMDKPGVKEELRKQFLGVKHTKEHNQKIKDALNLPEVKIKHKNSYTEEVREKISIGVKKSFINNPYLREISRQTLTKLMKSKAFRKKSIYSIRNTSPTKPEIIVDNILKLHSLNFEFVGNSKFWINYKDNNFNPDFINKKDKLIIEVFGWYWHTNKEAKMRDKLRLEAYKKYGYKTLVIWVEDKYDKNSFENKILNFVKND